MRKIVITSGKGGVGKTTVTATLGRKLADIGYSVVMVDGDVGLNNLDVVMGVETRVVYDVGDVAKGRCSLKAALVQDGDSGVFVLPSANDTTLLTAQTFRALTDELGEFDFVLIDCPAGIEHGFHRAVSAASEAIVVTTPSASAIRDADKVVALLNSYNLSEMGLVVNRIRRDMVSHGEMMSAEDIGTLLGLPPIGVIPEDDCITLYQQLGRVPDFASSDRAYTCLADNVATHSQKLYDLSTRRKWQFLRKAK